MLIIIIITALISWCLLINTVTLVDGLGSASTAAVTYGKTVTVCGIVAGGPTQSIRCYHEYNRVLSLLPNVSFREISGGRSFFCGVSHEGNAVHCWNTTSFQPKRIYHSQTVALTGLAVGDSQVCAREVSTGVARCWRGVGGGSNDVLKGYNEDNRYDDDLFPSPGKSFKFREITCGSGFACGILKNDGKVVCWGRRSVMGAEIQMGFENFSMSSLVAGDSHACGLTLAGALVCKGSNDSGQLYAPSSDWSNYEYSGLALGSNFTCGIQRRNGLVTCWGSIRRSHTIGNVSFELIVSGLDFVCGLTTTSLSMVCWGPGWSDPDGLIPLGMIIPGPCVQSSCGTCGTYPDSDTLCHGSGNICRSCQIELPLAVPLPTGLTPPSPSMDNDHQSVSPSSKGKNDKLLLSFLVVGLIGSFVGFCSFVYCLWTALIHRYWHRQVVEPAIGTVYTTDHGPINTDHGAVVKTTHELSSTAYSTPNSCSMRTRSFQMHGRQSSSSSKPEIFSLSELATATDNFSSKNKIGAGSFGVVYRGKLSDGRQVAVKRGSSNTSSSNYINNKKKKHQQFDHDESKESAFDAELALLSRLHHKHLVSLVGFCRQNDERLLVYHYITNGSLHQHLHLDIHDSTLEINSWGRRIKIALDAARGIEYLHNYAVPSVIHRDIKSSNILLDSDWTARVSDFGLSMIMVELEEDERVSAKAVGTVGYIDPEYYVMNVLTAKSDVYSLGVVMLELLTGKRAVFRDEDDGVTVTTVVEYYVGRLGFGGHEVLLDKRVGPPEMGNEAAAVQVFADTAVSCVRLEGTERPHIAEVVASLDKAFSLICMHPNTTLS